MEGRVLLRRWTREPVASPPPSLAAPALTRRQARTSRRSVIGGDFAPVPGSPPEDAMARAFGSGETVPPAAAARPIGAAAGSDPVSPSPAPRRPSKPSPEDSPPAGRRRVREQSVTEGMAARKSNLALKVQVAGCVHVRGGTASACGDRSPAPRSRTAQGSTTRSSRWTTSWGRPRASSAVWRPATDRSDARRVPDQALGERRAVGADDLDRVVGVERALDLAHTRGQQRPVVGAQGAARRRRRRRCARRRRARTRSTACGSRGAAAAAGPTVPTGAPVDRVDDHVGRRRRRRSPRARPTTPRSWPRRACSPSRRSPARCRCRRRRASSAASTSTISSISDALGVEAGIGGEQPGRCR